MKILTERPKGMKFEDYKEHLREQKRWLKAKRHGSIVYIASEIYDHYPTLKNGLKSKDSVKMKSNYQPFRGCVRDLKPL